MPIEVQMPQMGESVVEGTIAKWLVKPGDVVTEDQPLVEISTDKVDTEIPSPSAGTIAKLVAEEGQTLPVGAVIAIIEASGAGAPTAKPSALPQAPAQAQPGPPMAARVAPAAPAPEPTRAPSAPAPAPAAEAASAPAAAMPPGVRLPRADDHRRYSPVVVRMAAEHGLEIDKIPGTGIGGRVSKRDVEKYLASLRQGGATSGPAMPQPQAAHINGAASAPSAPLRERPAAPSVP
ncbi:MAG TPA: biotin/lipoyl-containing protein, partial [Candidatus Binataceae bacterium]|nr:biotin/lipoyl-containing protein [Candidatus Binataceae bacterium]